MQLQDNQKQKDFLRKYDEVNRAMEEKKTAEQSFSFNAPYIDLTHFPIDLNALSMWSAEQSKEAQAVLFYKEGNALKVGSTQPNNALLRKHLDALLKEHKLEPVIYHISQSSLDEVLAMYAHVIRPKHFAEETVEVKEQDDYTKPLKELGTDKIFTATQVLSILLGAAHKYQASDIHLEPEEMVLKVRFRLDGVLNDMVNLSKDYQKVMVSRIKILAKLKLNVENVPQDGRFTYLVDGQPTDVRVSVLPSAYGEGVVMRLLATQAKLLNLDELGFNGRAYEQIKNELAKPNGMIMTTGPTGSGKTTTLYAFLNILNQPGVKIITLEDPVEYKLEGVSQTPIDTRAGLTFAAGLRAILRQDPDVIMVGEIRDQETAETALQASLTGHVVLTTLHTNDAAGAIPRLINMGVKPFVIAPGLNAVIAQRLVRRLCPDCKIEEQLEPFMLTKVKRILSEIPKNSGVEAPKEYKFFHSPGCESCNHTGYKGRIGIYEVIIKSDLLEKMIMSSASTSDIRKAMIQEGMVTMMQDGLIKALQGITDVAEVFRVTQE